MKVLGPVLCSILVPCLIALPVQAGSDTETAAPKLALHSEISGAAISVKVTDETGAGVADAAVLVRLPESGDTGTFADGTHASVAYTDGSGTARIEGLHWSATNGSVPVRITATKGAARAGMLMDQPVGPAPVKTDAAVVVPPMKNDPPAPGQLPVAHETSLAPAAPAATVPMVTVTHGPTHEKVSGGSHKKWIILAAVVGAGAGAAFAIGGKKSSTSSSGSTTSTPTIGPPTVSVGGP